MPTTLRDIEWGDCLVPKTHDPKLMREIRRRGIMSTSATPYFLALPWIALNSMNLYGGLLLHLDRTLGERLWLAVSQDQSCRYCYASMRAGMRFIGTPESRIRRLEQDFFTTELEETDRLLVELARKISRSNPLVTAADVRPLLQAGCEPAVVREAAAFAGLTVAATRMSTLVALPLDVVEDIPDKWYARILRPLIGRYLRRAYRRGVPTHLTPEEETGPYEYVLRGLTGLPISKTIHGYLRDAWSSDELMPRQRALIFAVIARGTGAERAEAEAVRLLDDEGMAPAETERMLAHLASPQLDDRDLDIVRFARDTIRVHPKSVQIQGANLRTKLSLQGFLGVVGTAALANGISRTDFLAESF